MKTRFLIVIGISVLGIGIFSVTNNGHDLFHYMNLPYEWHDSFGFIFGWDSSLSKSELKVEGLEDIKNHPLVDEFYSKYPDAHEEVRSDHVSYFVGSDDSFKVRMNLYFDENYDLDYINLKCYLNRELQNDVPGNFISKYLKDFACDEYGSHRNEF